MSSTHYHGSLSYYSYCSLPLPSSVPCSPLSTPANVSTNTSSTAPGVTVQFFCTNGGSISGNATISCLLNGSWSGPVPTCVDVIARTGESLFPFLNCHCAWRPSLASFSDHLASSPACEQWLSLKCHLTKLPVSLKLTQLLCHFKNQLIKSSSGEQLPHMYSPASVSGNIGADVGGAIGGIVLVLVAIVITAIVTWKLA